MTQVCISLFDFNFENLSRITKELRGKLKLPHLPDPLFDDVSSFSYESVANAVQMEAMGIYNLLLQAIVKVIGYIGGAIRDFFPVIPIINVNLLDLMTGDGTVLQELVKRIKEDPTIARILGIFSSLPKENLDVPSFDAMEVFNSLVTQYMVYPLQLLFDKINEIAEKLLIGLLELPIPLPFPTMEEIWELLYRLSGVDTYIQMIEKVKQGALKLIDLFKSIAAFFGLPFDAPDPLFDDLSIPEIEFSFYFNSFLNKLCYGYLKPMIDFIIDKFSSVLSIIFTPICITVPDIPSI